jgi:hypothetical protein
LSDVEVFDGRFDGWAQKREGDINADIASLRKGIQDLKEEAAKINTAMISIAGVAGFGLPILATAAALSGPFAPFVIAAGVFAAVGTVASVVGLAVRKGGTSAPSYPIFS